MRRFIIIILYCSEKVKFLIPIPETTVDKTNGINAVCHRWTSSPYDTQPVISYNYGAKQYERVRSGINFNTIIGAGYTLIAWLLVIIFPQFWFGIFSDDVQMLSQGIEAMKIYFFGFVFMSLQFAGQSTFQAVGDAKHAIFFSLLRKVVIVVPLTLLLPRLGLGVIGVFAAEPVSNIIGGIASYLTMRMTVYKKIKNKSAVQ